MADIHDVADYLIVKLDEGGSPPSVHKINKLLYYVQGWSLALRDRRMFDGMFQAWVHGPINRALFDRFTGLDRSIYSVMDRSDVRPSFSFDALEPEEVRLIDDVLEAYGMLSSTDLQELSRSEAPWIKARGGKPRAAKCDTELDESDMRKFFRENMRAAA
jgi:uncharacterized phage-associated protein